MHDRTDTQPHIHILMHKHKHTHTFLRTDENNVSNSLHI